MMETESVQRVLRAVLRGIHSDATGHMTADITNLLNDTRAQDVTTGDRYNVHLNESISNNQPLNIHLKYFHRKKYIGIGHLGLRQINVTSSSHQQVNPQVRISHLQTSSNHCETFTCDY